MKKQIISSLYGRDPVLTEPVGAVDGLRKNRPGKPDLVLLFSVLLLVSIGVIMVFSASQYFAQYPPYNDTYFFLKRQLRNVVLGLIAMFFMYRMHYQAYRRVGYMAYFILFGVLLFMALYRGLETIGGAQRWTEVFGVQFQPSEFAKVILPMALARWVTLNRSSMPSLRYGFLPALLFFAVPTGLIFLQKDLSTSIVVAGSGFIIILCAGARWKHLGALFLSGVVAVVGAILIEPYRMDRVRALFDPWAFAQDEGWQTVQSLMAIGSGGLTGTGLGGGGSKWYYLPERHTDFIFSVLCEEMGFFGALMVIALLSIIVWRGVMIAVNAPNTYCSLLCIGLIGSIGVQAVINLWVCTGLLPVTGITLPFVSYGGTSMLVSLAAVGILLNISRYTEK